MKMRLRTACTSLGGGWITPATVALAILAAGGLHAQDARGPDKNAAKAQEAPAQVIPPAQVAAQAQEVNEILDELMALTAPDAELDTISASIGVLADSLASARAQQEFKNLERLSERPIRDLDSRWQIARVRVKGWETALQKKLEDLTEAIERSDRLAESWNATRDFARSARAPQGLRRQIESTVSAIAGAREKLEGRFRELLSLQETVGAQALTLNNDINRIEARRGELERQIFMIDAPPLWEGFTVAEDTTGVVASVQQTWSVAIGMAGRYLGQNIDRVVLHLVLSALFFGLFRLLRRQVGRMAGGESLAEPLPAAVRFLRRPLTATLLVLVFLVPYLYPDAPVGLTDFFRVVVLVPFLVLALVWFRPGMRVIVIAITVLYALGLTRELIADDPGAARVLLLAESVLGVATLLFVLRPGGVLRSPDAPPRARLVRRLSILALVLLVAAIGANAAGSVSLAWRLTSGVTKSAALAVFYGIIVLLADGALFFLVNAWLSRISRLVRRFSDVIVRFGIQVFSLAGMALWFLGVLASFDLQRVFVSWLGEILEAEWGIGSVQVSLGDLLLFAAVLVGSFMLARLVRLALEEEVFGRVTLPRGVPGAIGMVVRYSVVGLGIVLALAALGIDLGKFGLLAGALGVGLGFGLQNIVANFVSGIILAFERPIQVGDMVQLGSLWGTISSIGVRSTRVRSFDGSEVVIPNNDLISKEVTNWTLSDRLRRLSFPVKVEFGSDPRQVIDVMLKAVREHQVPLTSPEPFVIFEGLGDYYLNFTLYFWITTDLYLAGKNDVGMAVLDALKKAGIEIPSAPHRVTIEDRRRPLGGTV